jgi:hypothetical protein
MPVFSSLPIQPFVADMHSNNLKITGSNPVPATNARLEKGHPFGGLFLSRSVVPAKTGTHPDVCASHEFSPTIRKNLWE